MIVMIVMIVMIGVLVALQIVSSSPPLSPADGAAVLRKSPGLSNRTNPPPAGREGGPLIIVFGGSPTAGPFGEFKPFPRTVPLSRGPYVFRSSARNKFRVWDSGIHPRSSGSRNVGRASRF
jgi:hypothetical protein